MKYCDGKIKCRFLGIIGDCLKKSECEHQIIPLYARDEEPEPTIEESTLTRIADALERVAKELERQNKLKAATLRATIESDYLDEIMED